VFLARRGELVLLSQKAKQALRGHRQRVEILHILSARCNAAMRQLSEEMPTSGGRSQHRHRCAGFRTPAIDGPDSATNQNRNLRMREYLIGHATEQERGNAALPV